MLTTGQPFPEFEQDTVKSQRIGLDDLRGGVVVVAVGHSAMCTGAQYKVGDPYEAAPLCTLLDELRELLDQQGTIAYTDSEFADRYDAFGCLRPERPDVLAPHLAWAILRLLD